MPEYCQQVLLGINNVLSCQAVGSANGIGPKVKWSVFGLSFHLCSIFLSQKQLLVKIFKLAGEPHSSTGNHA